MDLTPLYTTKGEGDEWSAAANYLGYSQMREPLKEGRSEVVRRDRFTNDRVEIEVIETEHTH